MSLTHFFQFYLYTLIILISFCICDKYPDIKAIWGEKVYSASNSDWQQARASKEVHLSERDVVLSPQVFASTNAPPMSFTETLLTWELSTLECRAYSLFLLDFLKKIWSHLHLSVHSWENMHHACLSSFSAGWGIILAVHKVLGECLHNINSMSSEGRLVVRLFCPWPGNCLRQGL